ncbi:FMN-linked oxidoreductase [Macrolepiota fuliginosa MF-IS2]|uniref:FMN-linked oxidoreductase n=1 Tax=Macrolepiota fuliginosa MF-IS2 TaxID=1400762 RepID=A0A9P5XDC8_9AGAR|nr:FMN-linked oxidoreductase [Macrolepiota fuliginosa MF-IS2]
MDAYMASHKAKDSPTGVFAPIEFPCGARASNRLVKAPMYEHLSAFLGGPPNDHHLALYSLWSQYDWGMVITGNVQVSKSHLTLGRDLVVPDQLSNASVEPFKALADVIKGPDGRTRAIMQLSHAGRQSTNFIGGRYPFERPLAPSAISVGANTTVDDPLAGLAQSILFQTPKEMSIGDITEVVEGFVKGARLACESGFDGVELHVAHGYLLAQFLSPKSNARQDEYSVHSEDGLYLLHQIIDRIRAIVEPRFIIGVKLNASDYLTDAPINGCDPPLCPEETRALQHVLCLARWGKVDFIDISGGDYENPEFMMSETTKHGRRQALFARFSQQAIKALDSAGFKAPLRPVIMLTGGLRTPSLLQSALQSGQTDMLGIGRGSVLCPHIPQIMTEFDQGRRTDIDEPFGAEPKLSTPKLLNIWPLVSIWRSLSKVKLIGAGLNMAWYTIMIRRLALAGLRRKSEGISAAAAALERPDYTIGGLGALVRMYLWIPCPKISIERSLIFVLVLGLLTVVFAVS